MAVPLFYVYSQEKVKLFRKKLFLKTDFIFMTAT